MSTRRPGVIYLIRVRRPGVWWSVVGYVGQTRQHWLTRIEQHKKDQPWADTIVSYRVLWEFKKISDISLDMVEAFFIWIMLPLYNDQHNRANPRRITAVQSKAQAQARGRGFVLTAPRTASASRSSGSVEESLVFAAMLVVLFILVGVRYMGLM